MTEKARLECLVQPEVKDAIDEIAIRMEKRRGPCMVELCKLALDHPNHPPKSFEGVSEGKSKRLSVYVDRALLKSARDYRVRHRLVTNREFFCDALMRGIAVCFDPTCDVGVLESIPA